jgi:hypothetical protein
LIFFRGTAPKNRSARRAGAALHSTPPARETTATGGGGRVGGADGAARADVAAMGGEIVSRPAPAPYLSSICS